MSMVVLQHEMPINWFACTSFANHADEGSEPELKQAEGAMQLLLKDAVAVLPEPAESK